MYCPTIALQSGHTCVTSFKSSIKNGIQKQQQHLRIKKRTITICTNHLVQVVCTYPTKQSPAAIAYTAKPFLGCGIVTMVFWQLGHWTRQGDSLRYWLKIGIALGCVTKACFGGWGGLNPSELKKKLISLVY